MCARKKQIREQNVVFKWLYLPSQLALILGHMPINIPSLIYTLSETKTKEQIIKEEPDKLSRCLQSLTYSSIAPRRKSYLNVRFHQGFLHRW